MARPPLSLAQKELLSDVLVPCFYPNGSFNAANFAHFDNLGPKARLLSQFFKNKSELLEMRDLLSKSDRNGAHFFPWYTTDTTWKQGVDVVPFTDFEWHTLISWCSREAPLEERRRAERAIAEEIREARSTFLGHRCCCEIL